MSETKENPYLSYSMDSLEVMAQQFALMLGGGQTTLGNGDNLGEAYEQVCEAIAEREKTDYCIHGSFKWDEVLCHACEME